MEDKINQLESSVESLKSTNNMLLDEIKRINSKLDAIDSKVSNPKRKFSLDRESLKEMNVNPNFLILLKLRQFDL